MQNDFDYSKEVNYRLPNRKFSDEGRQNLSRIEILELRVAALEKVLLAILDILEREESPDVEA